MLQTSIFPTKISGYQSQAIAHDYTVGGSLLLHNTNLFSYLMILQTFSFSQSDAYIFVGLDETWGTTIIWLAYQP